MLTDLLYRNIEETYKSKEIHYADEITCTYNIVVLIWF